MVALAALAGREHLLSLFVVVEKNSLSIKLGGLTISSHYRISGQVTGTHTHTHTQRRFQFVTASVRTYTRFGESCDVKLSGRCQCAAGAPIDNDSRQLIKSFTQGSCSCFCWCSCCCPCLCVRPPSNWPQKSSVIALSQFYLFAYTHNHVSGLICCNSNN